MNSCSAGELPFLRLYGVTGRNFCHCIVSLRFRRLSDVALSINAKNEVRLAECNLLHSRKAPASVQQHEAEHAKPAASRRWRVLSRMVRQSQRGSERKSESDCSSPAQRGAKRRRPSREASEHKPHCLLH